MPNDYFAFKKFTVRQERCAMKVGTDGVLLGAWVDVGNAQRILDVGTGTGLIALMLAQRSEALVTAIEIDEAAAGQAAENFRDSPWSQRLRCLQTSLQDFQLSCDNKFDLIVCNPPFFRNGFRPENHLRGMARHETALTLHDLMQAAGRIIHDPGRLALIYPFDEQDRIASLARSFGMTRQRTTIVKPYAGKPPHRILTELGKQQHFGTSPDVLELWDTQNQTMTDAYAGLTRAFYLKL